MNWLQWITKDNSELTAFIGDRKDFSQLYMFIPHTMRMVLPMVPCISFESSVVGEDNLYLKAITDLADEIYKDEVIDLESCEKVIMQLGLIALTCINGYDVLLKKELQTSRMPDLSLAARWWDTTSGSYRISIDSFITLLADFIFLGISLGSKIRYDVVDLSYQQPEPATIHDYDGYEKSKPIRRGSPDDIARDSIDRPAIFSRGGAMNMQEAIRGMIATANPDGLTDSDLKVKVKSNGVLTDYHYEVASFFFFQLRHDERYHRDINNLHLMDRLRHLHNHVIKNQANIQRKLENNGDISKDITDCCIVTLSALTALGYGGYTTTSLGDYYLKQSIIRDQDIQHELGCIAKLLEGYDHVEALRYIEDLTAHFHRLFVKSLSMFYKHVSSSFHVEYVKRLRGVQTRNPLHQKFVEHFGGIEL